jgi:hypothetical protein
MEILSIEELVARSNRNPEILASVGRPKGRPKGSKNLEKDLTDKEIIAQEKSRELARAQAQHRRKLDLTEKEKLELAMQRAKDQENAEIQEISEVGAGVTLIKFKGKAGHQFLFPRGYSLVKRIKALEKREKAAQELLSKEDLLLTVELEENLQED